MGLVSLQHKVLQAKVFQPFSLGAWTNGQFRKWFWLTLQLDLERFNVVQVDVGIAQGMNKVTRLQVAHVGDDDGEERIASNIEGNA